MTPTALLIDGNALIHRAWHALPPLTSPDGTIVNAVYGFTTVLQKILASERPEYFVVCWDTPEPTYRHEAAPEYKAQREDQPDEFYAQFPLTKEVVESFGGKNIELPGYEADDLLATAATRLAKEGVAVTILTSDRDAWQIIRPGIRIMSLKKGVSETVIFDEKTLPELAGLKPSQVKDWKALAGDSSDNLKGVSGIGDKTALDLLQTYGDLEGIFRAAKDPSSAIKPGVRQKLLGGEQDARATLHLVTLMMDAPMNVSLEEMKRQRVDEAVMRAVFTKFGFKTLLARMLGAKNAPSPLLRRGGLFDGNHEKKSPPMHIGGVEGVLLSATDFLSTRPQFLIVVPLMVSQESLFSDAPVLALGSDLYTTIVSTAHLKDAGVRQQIGSFLENGSLPKIAHDLKLSWHWCNAHGFALNGLSFDTEIATYLLSAGDRSYDLAMLASTRFGKTISEDGEQGGIEMVDLVRDLYRSLSTELVDQHLDSVMDRFEIPLISILGKMEDEGVMIDRAYFKTLHDDFLKEKQRLEREMIELAGEDFNPASPSQLAHILFEKLEISSKGIKRGKTGLSTAAAELEKLEGAHPIIEKVGDYREVAKLLSTYVDALPLLADANGRVHTTFNQTIAATGRLSSTEPNVQNIPIRTELGRKIRRGFVARPGFKLLSCDYSQIELRIIAALAKDEKMLEAFRLKHDIHTATAAAIWHIPMDEVTKDQRRAAKAINFGIIYGQGPQGLAKAAGIRFDEARQFIDEYFHVYSGVREYLDQTKALAHAQGFVETLFGRKRYLADINSPMPQLRAFAERMAINMPVQGTAADVMKLAMIDLAKELPRIDSRARMLLQVHDEIVFEVPEDFSKTSELIALMEQTQDVGAPIVVEAKEGKNWEEMTKVA
jgi:DNA polymerase-1